MPAMRRLVVISAALVCALLASGCGNKQETVTLGETEGIYLDVDELKYQIQISRYMNANDVEDRSYLAGLPQSTAAADGRGDLVRGLHPRAEHDGRDDRAGQRLRDRGHAGERLPADPARHETSTRSPTSRTRSAPKSLIPRAGLRRAPTTTIQGSLLLFKVKTESLQNRPLEFRFKGGVGTTGVVDLDV